MVGGSALDPPRRLAQQRERAFRPAEQLVEPGERFAGLDAGLHRRAFFGEASFLAFFGCELLDFAAGMLEELAVALGRRSFGARAWRARVSIRVTSAQAAATAPVSSLPNASSSAR